MAILKMKLSDFIYADFLLFPLLTGIGYYSDAILLRWLLFSEDDDICMLKK